MRSLRRTALLWMTAVIAGVGLAGAGIAYGLALREANRFMDSQLRQIALNAGPGLREQDVPALRHDPEDDFVVEIWDAQGKLVHVSPPGAGIPRQARPGFTSIEASGERWRVFTSGDGSQTIQVAQQTEVRRELAASAGVQAAVPILVIIPVGWLVLGWAMGRILGDLHRLAAKVEALPVESREALDLAQVPIEVAPLVTAMNALIERLRQSLSQQRKFLSDAAHELRTPLTALNLQIANLAPGEITAAADLAELQRGARRAALMTDQLLRIARYEASAAIDERGDVDLADVVVEAMADHVPLAESRGIDLGLVRSTPTPTRGDPRELRILFGNLIDNAVKYTPPGGVVDVAVSRAEGRVHITITDTGPGIEPAIMPRIFDRFVRAAPAGIDGSGLGLAIARAIAERHGLRITVANRDDATGLRVVVASRSGTPLRLLLVEDNQDLALWLARTLRAGSYTGDMACRSAPSVERQQVSSSGRSTLAE